MRGKPMLAGEVRVGDAVQELLGGRRVWGTVCAVLLMPKTVRLAVDFGSIFPERYYHRNTTLLHVRRGDDDA